MNETVNPILQAIEQRASLPFSLVNDDLFIGILLACFLAITILLADSSSYLPQLVHDYSIGHAKSSSDEVHTSRSFYMRMLLFAQAFVSYAMTVVVYAQASGFAMERADAVKYLLWGMAGVVAWLLIRLLLFAVVNGVLFHRLQTQAWTQVFADVFLFGGLFFFVLNVLGIFIQLSAQIILVIAICLLAVMEIGLAFKAFHIFFVKKYGGLQLFVYLCALEWIPLLVAGRFLIQYCTTI